MSYETNRCPPIPNPWCLKRYSQNFHLNNNTLSRISSIFELHKLTWSERYLAKSPPAYPPHILYLPSYHTKFSHGNTIKYRSIFGATIKLTPGPFWLSWTEWYIPGVKGREKKYITLEYISRNERIHLVFICLEMCILLDFIFVFIIRMIWLKLEGIPLPGLKEYCCHKQKRKK